MNQWPNVKLRVIEGWDEDYRHSMNSLHYEGRAVDITTSDKDKSKYGMLARLAVEAGFDWVHYESRSHVHCSVRSEKADDVRNNGCFDARSLVETPMGQMEMAQLQTHDMVLTMNSLGELQFSPVLMWLDRDETSSELFVELQTKSGQTIRLTSSHLIYVADEPMPDATIQPVQRTLQDDLNEANKSQATNGNIYYYYDISGSGSGSGGGGAGTGAGGGQQNPVAVGAPLGDAATNIGTPTNGLNNSTTTSESDDSSKPTRDESLSHELNDYIYATYARNALVGQYLLISSSGEQAEFGSSSSGSSGSSSSSSSSSGGQRANIGRQSELGSRLTFARQNELGGAFGKRETSRNRKQSPRERANRSSMTKTRTKAKFDQIVSMNFVTRQGIYAPLTREGNIVVNSVVASCYAVISDHDLAHLSMAPVRWLSMLQEKLFGFRPETPAYERTVDFMTRRNLYESSHDRQTPVSIDQNNNQNESKESPNYQTTNSLNRTTTTTKSKRHIHWYPILLYNIARFILPTAYLY